MRNETYMWAPAGCLCGCGALSAIWVLVETLLNVIERHLPSSNYDADSQTYMRETGWPVRTVVSKRLLVVFTAS